MNVWDCSKMNRVTDETEIDCLTLKRLLSVCLDIQRQIKEFILIVDLAILNQLESLD